MQHPTQSLTEVVRILHIMHSSTQLDTTHPSTLTTASPPTITTLRFLARTLNIPTAHDTFTHPQPNPTHYQHAYSQAATICPCPPRHNMRPHHSVLYQFCEQLAKSIPRPITAQSHIPMRCPTCTITSRNLPITNKINPHPPTNTSASTHPVNDRAHLCDHRSRSILVYHKYH